MRWPKKKQQQRWLILLASLAVNQSLTLGIPANHVPSESFPAFRVVQLPHFV